MRQMRSLLCVRCAVSSVPIPGGRILRSVKNRGGSFDEVVDQNFRLFFTFPYFSRGKLHL